MRYGKGVPVNNVLQTAQDPPRVGVVPLDSSPAPRYRTGGSAEPVESAQLLVSAISRDIERRYFLR